MAGYTKADYDTQYSIRLQILDPATSTYKRSPIRLHYHRAVMESTVRKRWDSIVPLLSITSADKVVVVGSGFGWGVERLIELTGCQAIGIDISDYIDTEKELTEEAEIDAAIISAGYDPLTGHGLEAKTAAYTAEPKAKQRILKNDLSTTKMRNNVKKEFGNSAPTWIITEDMMTDVDDATIVAWKTQAEKLSGTQICHVLRESYGANQKTAEEWNTFTGHTIITIGDYRRIG